MKRPIILTDADLRAVDQFARKYRYWLTQNGGTAIPVAHSRRGWLTIMLNWAKHSLATDVYDATHYETSNGEMRREYRRKEKLGGRP